MSVVAVVVITDDDLRLVVACNLRARRFSLGLSVLIHDNILYGEMNRQVQLTVC